MALNYSRPHLFSDHISDDKLILPFGIMNGYRVEGICHGSLEPDQEKNYACFTTESDSKDIVDLLPSDPFGMDIQTTFTAITGWLEDLEINCDGYMTSNTCNAAQNRCRWDFFWDHGLSFASFPSTVHFSESSNSAASNSLSNLVSYEMPFLPHNFFPGAVPFDEKNIHNLVDICSKEKGVCDTEFLQAFGIFNTVGFEEQSDKIGVCLDQTSCVEWAPHEAFTFVLSYLGVKELLSVEGVCKSLLSSVRNDPWLWTHIHIDQPLNERITDDVLMKLVRRAQGQLQCLSLVECPKVTDDGFRFILNTNPQLSKLYIPGCTRISIECVIEGIRAYNSQKNVGGIKHLRVGGLYGIKHEHYEELKSLLGVDGENRLSPLKQYFYHRRNFYVPYEDDRGIDIEMCQRCEKYRLVYDCPSEGCNVQCCRACTLCIGRCAQCGRCVNDTEFEETFCLELLCSDCFND